MHNKLTNNGLSRHSNGAAYNIHSKYVQSRVISNDQLPKVSVYPLIMHGRPVSEAIRDKSVTCICRNQTHCDE